jgi:hypothetical protein
LDVTRRKLINLLKERRIIMGTIAYKGGTVVYSGLETPPSSLKAVSMGGKIYANVAALVSGESLSAGDIFYLTSNGDTTDAALAAAMTVVLGSYVSYAIMPYAAFKVGTPATTVTYVTLTEMGIDPVAFLAEFAAIDANVLAATNGSYIKRGSAWGVESAGKLQEDPTTGVVTCGKFVSAAVGSGNVVTATVTKAGAFYADDGAAVLTTGTNARVWETRMLILGAHGTGDVSIGGFEGHAKLVAAAGTNGHKYGLWGYFECADSAAAITNFGCYGVLGMLDVPTSASIAANTYPAAIGIISNTLAGTHTGKAVCINVETPVAGTWDALLRLTSASGPYTANTKYLTAAGNSLLSGTVKVYVDGTLGYIPILAANPTT